jgi:integrase
MNERMNQTYRLFRRPNGVYYYQHRESGKQLSLGTKNKGEATRLLNAKNEGSQHPLIARQIGRAYYAAADPDAPTRTWRFVFAEIIKSKAGPTASRWVTAEKDGAFDSIRDLPLVETRAEHFLKVLETGTVSTNVYLRRLHNFSLDLGWLPWPVLPKKRWPKVRYKEKRAITTEEHERIIDREQNPERRAFYQLLWELGGSQTDIACLTAEDIDWTTRTITYSRKKISESSPQATIGSGLEVILRSLPSVGALFPYLRTVRECDRATEFKQRCKKLGITGVTLHCYRYGWAERAKQAGYPERFAQQVLGHSSKAVHRAYAKKAKVVLPSLEEWQRRQAENNVIPVQFPPKAETEGAAPGCEQKSLAV